MKPYYSDESVTIFHGDCRDVLPTLDKVDLVLTDPPYGIAFESSKTGHDGGVALPSIQGDEDATVRDFVVKNFQCVPMLVFGSWKVSKPVGVKAVLVWEKGDHVGMGDLSLPWKPNTEEIYVIGSGFTGHRGSSVIRIPAPVSWNSTNHGRSHPNEKPVALIKELLLKCPEGVVLDPFMGSGTTLRAAKDLNRKAIGIEIEEKYCEIAANRMSQLAMQL